MPGAPSRLQVMRRKVEVEPAILQLDPPRPKETSGWIAEYITHPLRTSHASQLEAVLGAVDDLTPHISEVCELTSKCRGGARGTIWTGNHNESTVALKTMRAASEEKQAKHLIRELAAWTRLHSPHVLELLGVYNHGLYGPAMVSPWMSRGTLRKHASEGCTAQERIALLLDIAAGLSYLHNQRPVIVHGDLKADNVLIGPNKKACLADFGLAAVQDGAEMADHSDVDLSQSETSGNPRWMSPERLIPDQYGKTRATAMSPAADAWSFGMVIYETFSGRLPFHHLATTEWGIGLAILRGQRPQHPGVTAEERGMCPELWELAKECWLAEPGKRPVTSHLVKTLSLLVHSDS